MARVLAADVQAWLELTKFTVTDPIAGTNLNQLLQIETEIISRVAGTYPTDYLTWTNDTNTPALIKVAIAKMFAAWLYRKQYSEDLPEDDAVYAAKLEANAEMLVSGIIDGTIDIPGVTTPSAVGPTFYPTDASSAMEPTRDDPSLGPEKFSMGMRF